MCTDARMQASVYVSDLGLYRDPRSHPARRRVTHPFEGSPRAKGFIPRTRDTERNESRRTTEGVRCSSDASVAVSVAVNRTVARGRRIPQSYTTKRDLIGWPNVTKVGPERRM